MMEMPCMCPGCGDVVELNDMLRDPCDPTRTGLVCAGCAETREAEGKRAMTPEEQRQYAAELVLAHAQDVEYLSVFEMAEEYHGEEIGEEIGEEDGRAVHDLIRTAVVTVSFPDCDLEWTNQDEEDE